MDEIKGSSSELGNKLQSEKLFGVMKDNDGVLCITTIEILKSDWQEKRRLVIIHQLIDCI